MSRTTGLMRQLLTIQRRTALEDDFEDTPDVWVNVVDVYAAEEPLRGAELIAARQVNEQITSKLRIRWSADVEDLSANDRFQDADGNVISIVSVLNTGARNRWVECQVVRRA